MRILLQPLDDMGQMDFLYDVVVAAIIKDEGPYLAEWLDYHERAGIDHFLLYDNGSTDDTAEVLRPYIERGYVTCVRWPGTCQQLPVYRHVLKTYRFFCRYIAFIDADEFLLPRVKASIPELVHEIMDQRLSWPDRGGLVLNWRLYGTSGFREPGEYDGLLRSFVHRAEEDYEMNRLVKSIVDPRRTKSFLTPYFALYCPFSCAYDESGNQVGGFLSENSPDNRLVVNHYATKSRQEWMVRHSRGTADYNLITNNESLLEKYDRNEVYDDSINSYLASRPEPTADYNARRQKWLEDEINRIAGILAGEDTGRYGMSLILQAFYACGTLLGGYLSKDEQQQIQHDIAQNTIEKLNTSNMPIEEAFILIDSLPELVHAGSDIWRDLRPRMARFVGAVCEVLREIVPAARECYTYDYLAKLLQA